MSSTVVVFYNKKGRELRTLTVINPVRWATNHFIRHPNGYVAIYHEGKFRHCFSIEQVQSLLPKSP